MITMQRKTIDVYLSYCANELQTMVFQRDLLFFSTVDTVLESIFKEMKNVKKIEFYQNRFLQTSDFSFFLIHRSTGDRSCIDSDFKLYNTVDANIYVLSIQDRYAWMRCDLDTAFHGNLSFVLQTQWAISIPDLKKALFLRAIEELQKRNIFVGVDFTARAEKIVEGDVYFLIYMYKEQLMHNLSQEKSTKIIADLLGRRCKLGAYLNIWDLQ